MSDRREKKSHLWARDPNDWYVESKWCAARLFEEELFEGTNHIDCQCGLRPVWSGSAARFRAWFRSATKPPGVKLRSDEGGRCSLRSDLSRFTLPSTDADAYLFLRTIFAPIVKPRWDDTIMARTARTTDRCRACTLLGEDA